MEEGGARRDANADDGEGEDDFAFEDEVSGRYGTPVSSAVAFLAIKDRVSGHMPNLTCGRTGHATSGILPVSRTYR